ncbi:MAG: DUF2505 family protein [Actinophytocola sp.]|nr:DUF2505 family protein [Actinophytocola sp.]
MPSRIEHSTTFPYPFDQVLAAFTSESALRQRLDDIGGKDAELLSHEKSASTISYRMRQGIPGEKLPSVVSKVHSGDLHVERDQQWQVAGETASGTATANVTGVPGAITARSELTPQGGGTALRITGEVKVNVPLIGGKIERTIAENVGQLLDRESQHVAETLGKDG